MNISQYWYSGRGIFPPDFGMERDESLLFASFGWPWST